MKSMLLVTAGFPYGESERSFIATEFQYLTKYFNVYVLANVQDDSMQYGGPQNVPHEGYVQRANAADIARALALDEFRAELKNGLASARKPGLALRRAARILGYAAHAEALVARMREIVTSRSVDIIYTYWRTPATLAALLIKRGMNNVKVVTRLHGYDLFNERTDTGWQPYSAMMSGTIDKFYFVSGMGEKYFQEHWGGNGGTFYLGSPDHGVIDNDYCGRLVLVSCSSLIGLKRVNIIIEALSAMPDRCEIEWHHVGDGNMRGELESEALRLLGGRKNISYRFWGNMDNEEVFRLYHNLKPHLFITTSGSEGLPVSIQEALSMGIPVMGTAVGGIPEIVLDGETGILLSADPDKEEAAAAIEKYYHMAAGEKQRLSRNARNFWQEKLDADKNAMRLVRDMGRIAGDLPGGAV